MSVINKMLKDLDKRGAEVAAGNATPGAIRFAPPNDSHTRSILWIILLMLLVLGGAYAWWMWGDSLSSMIKPAPSPLVASAPPPVQASPIAPPMASESAVAETPVGPVPPMASQSVEANSDKSTAPAPKTEREDPAKAIPAPVLTDGAMTLALSNTLASIPMQTAKAPKAPTVRERGKRGAKAQESAQMSKETTPEQRADNTYAKAISLIESGQKAEAISALENLLVQNPRHASGRQTLVGLLLDAKRPSDAVRALQDGLRLDPSRTGMTMVLARVQVEIGDTKAAIASLQRSLPYAVKTPEYQAFLAALFQREKQHGEAIEHYRIALRLAPKNGLWWMGYGISLQAENRPTDARSAFVHARDTERLTPELRAFVEQKINQLK